MNDPFEHLTPAERHPLLYDLYKWAVAASYTLSFNDDTDDLDALVEIEERYGIGEES